MACARVLFYGGGGDRFDKSHLDEATLLVSALPQSVSVHVLLSGITKMLVIRFRSNRILSQLDEQFVSEKSKLLSREVEWLSLKY